MNLAEATKLLKIATCPEDLFGPIETDRPGELPKKRFRELARATHPDNNKSNKAAAAAAFTLLEEWQRSAEAKLKAGAYGDRSAVVHATIKTRTESYTVDRIVAPGDLCNVYGGTGKKGRAVVLKVTRSPANNDLVENESRKLAILLDEKPTKGLPALIHISPFIESFELQDAGSRKRVNVFKRLDGYYTLAEVRRQYPEGLDIRDAAWMWNRMLSALALAHAANIVHGAVTPDHFMVCPDAPKTHNGVLIDWCYAVRQSSPLKAICPKYRSFYPAEVFDKRPATTGTDIYMAALCFLYLLGGDVEKRTFPTTLHHQFKGFIRACLLGPAHRPKDALDLFTDFNKLLADHFGPRKFRAFQMPRTSTKI